MVVAESIGSVGEYGEKQDWKGSGPGYGLCYRSEAPWLCSEPLILEYKSPFMSPLPQDVQMPFPLFRESGLLNGKLFHR